MKFCCQLFLPLPQRARLRHITLSRAAPLQMAQWTFLKDPLPWNTMAVYEWHSSRVFGSLSGGQDEIVEWPEHDLQMENVPT